MRRSRELLLVGLVLACSSGPPASPPVRAVATPAARSCKPEPPITVAIEARGDLVEVAATPTTAVADLELELILPDGSRRRAQPGATAAGVTRTLSAKVSGTGEVIGVARVPVEGVSMTRDASIRLGPTQPPPQKRVVKTPDGDLVKEVRR